MKLKIGVLGAGHLGRIHMKCISELPEVFEFIGFHDPDLIKSAEAAGQFGKVAFPTMESLMDAVDVVDIVTPTVSHFACAAASMRRQKHVFIEKPVTETVEQAALLIKLAHEANVKAQVGHVERFNPAFQAVLPYFSQPRFIETHRLAEFNPRGTDVSVVLDLMIHDIDIVLATTRANVRSVSASGVSVLSDTPDIANARIELDNGCVANLTASRISLKKMRKSRFFQRDAYISVDFLTRQSEIVRMRTVEGDSDPFALVIDLGEKGKKEILFDKPAIPERNAIRDELEAFALAILGNTESLIPLGDGMRALEVAMMVLDKMKQNRSVLG